MEEQIWQLQRGYNICLTPLRIFKYLVCSKSQQIKCTWWTHKNSHTGPGPGCCGRATCRSECRWILLPPLIWWLSTAKLLVTYRWQCGVTLPGTDSKVTKNNPAIFYEIQKRKIWNKNMLSKARLCSLYSLHLCEVFNWLVTDFIPPLSWTYKTMMQMFGIHGWN